MTKHTRLTWPEPPLPLPTGLTRKIFVTLPLGFKLNRGVMNARVTEGMLSQEDAERLIQEDEYRKAINAILGVLQLLGITGLEQADREDRPLVRSSVAR